jgi:hypothetical protein
MMNFVSISFELIQKFLKPLFRVLRHELDIKAYMISTAQQDCSVGLTATRVSEPWGHRRAEGYGDSIESLQGLAKRIAQLVTRPVIRLERSQVFLCLFSEIFDKLIDILEFLYDLLR